MRGSFLGGVLFANAESFPAQAANTSGPGWTYVYAGQKVFEDIQPVGGFGNNYFGGWLHAGE